MRVLPGPKSLKWRLVSRFSLVLCVMLAFVNVGFFIFVVEFFPTAIGVDETVKPTIRGSIVLTADDIEIRRTPDLERLSRETPTFWFAVQRAGGAARTFGQVPSQYEAFVPLLSTLESMDVRGMHGDPMTAVLASVETTAGRVNVLFGGKNAPGSRLANVLWDLRIVYIPFTLAPLFAVFLALPFIVGRALSGVRKTTARAATISPTSLGVRLPTEDVVEELHPLVNAINVALARIDEMFGHYKRFLTDAAHELRTPIAILQTRLESYPEGPQRERLLLDVGRLAALAEHLLDLQRFQTIEAWEDVELVSLCESVTADIAPLAISAGYEVEFSAVLSTVRMRGDRISIERAVTNLVRNAIDHGGGKGRIEIRILSDASIEVSDQGPGIDPGDQARIFEPFFRVRPKSTGAGLGLSLVRHIAESLGGKVCVQSDGQGAKFRLSLPVQSG